ASEATDDLVDDDQHIVLVTDLPYLGEVVVGRHHKATGALDWLDDQGGHGLRSFAHNRFFQRPGSGGADALPLLNIAAIAIGVWIGDMEKAIERQPKRLPIGFDTGGAAGRQGNAVVGLIPGDELALLGPAQAPPIVDRRLE